MTPNTIEREITIEASAERVWALVSEPGWWINDGDVVPHEIEMDGRVARVTDPAHGTFAVSVLELDPPRYAKFGWLTGERPQADRPETTVEFWITESASGVVLRVVEAGFASLPVSEDERARMVEENTSGWEQELAAAQRHCRSDVRASS